MRSSALAPASSFAGRRARARDRRPVDDLTIGFDRLVKLQYDDRGARARVARARVARGTSHSGEPMVWDANCANCFSLLKYLRTFLRTWRVPRQSQRDDQDWREALARCVDAIRPLRGIPSLLRRNHPKALGREFPEPGANPIEWRGPGGCTTLCHQPPTNHQQPTTSLPHDTAPGSAPSARRPWGDRTCRCTGCPGAASRSADGTPPRDRTRADAKPESRSGAGTSWRR